MNNQDYNELMIPLVQEIESRKEEVIDHWINGKRLQNTLKKHSIHPVFFKKHFGYKMLNNLLSILKAEKSAGQCRVIHVLQHFSLDKNIPLQDIYYICSDLKNTLSFFYMNYFYGKIPVEFFWELTNIMDQNFTGVMQEYNLYPVESEDRNFIKTSVIPKESSVVSSNRIQDIRYSKEERYGSAVLFEMVDSSIVDKIDQFTEDLDEFLILLYKIEESSPESSRALMQRGVSIIHRFYALIDLLIVFPVIASTFKNLANFLEELSIEFYENEERKHLLTQHLIGLILDLEHWIDIIFIKRIADDVHYFDASFANNVLEIEWIANQKNIIIHDDNDLEFF